MFSSATIIAHSTSNLVLRRYGSILLWCHTWYFGSECIGVTFKYGRDSLFSDWFILHVVAATITIAILAILTWSKTLTVQFQTSRVLTITVLFSTIQILNIHCGPRKGRCYIDTRWLRDLNIIHWQRFNYIWKLIYILKTFNLPEVSLNIVF